MVSKSIILNSESRTLRRQLAASTWVVLEEVALAAVADTDGRLIAAISARQIAELLGIDPGTAAVAVRHLRHRGLVNLERQPGPIGRFGLSSYVLVPPPGLIVMSSPCGDLPGMEKPSMAKRDEVAQSGDMGATLQDAVSALPRTAPGELGRTRRSRQSTLDLGWAGS